MMTQPSMVTQPSRTSMMAQRSMPSWVVGLKLSNVMLEPRRFVFATRGTSVSNEVIKEVAGWLEKARRGRICTLGVFESQ